MSRLLCCLRARHRDMGAALSHPQEGEACDGGAVPASPPTMADVIRERKKKAGGAGLGTLRRRIAAAARRPRDSRPDRGCEHARFIRSVVSSWRVAEVFLLCEELESGAALRDLLTQAELAREPAAALHADLAALYTERLWCDVELAGAGWVLPAHRVVLAARCAYFRDLLHRYPKSTRVPLEGACAGLRRDEAEALMLALYAGASPPASAALCDACRSRQWERGGSEVELDILSGDSSTYRRACSCRREAAGARWLAPVLGFSLDSLQRDMKYLLDSGEMCDARLSWRAEAGGAAFGFRALELPCHTLLLAARSRFFRSVMSRRPGAVGAGAGPTGAGAGPTGAGPVGAGGTVCVDEKVLPRRFAQALLHAAYTDQVDLSLIGRSSSSPAAASSASTRSSRGSATAQLDDAFQLYEIARFLEMPIVVQGCEDAVVLALSADTLPHVLRWCAQPHASAWVHRQAMRYLRDEFPAIMSTAAAARLPRAALADALASPFLQASESQALRAALRWAERAAAARADGGAEPNVLWHTGHAARGRGRRAGGAAGGGAAGGGAAGGEGAVREALAALAPLVRTEHLPPDCELLQQAIRRGVLAAPAHLDSGASSADAWLGRGAFRPPRCFLPYLDEIKALLEDQAVPEAEVAVVRRARYLHRIPDTLYMVRDMREGGAGDVGGAGGGGGEAGVRACVPARVLARGRARVRELRTTPTAARALALAADAAPVHRQIALRAVREMSLPDACADLLLADTDQDSDSLVCGGREGAGFGADDAGPEPLYASRARLDCDVDCCRSSTGSLRCGSTGSLRAAPSLHATLDGRGAGACRRDLPARPSDTPHRSGVGVGMGAGAGSGSAAGRLSAAVPDVAMAPNGNTHLLTPHYLYPRPRPHPQQRPEYGGGVGSVSSVGSLGMGVGGGMGSGMGVGVGAGAGVVQLDLGDGATHTPRPGSRAQRAGHSARHYREHTQVAGGSVGGHHGGTDEGDLRAAIEMSVLRAYGSLHSGGRRADLLPNTDFSALRSRASPGPGAGGGERARDRPAAGAGPGAGGGRHARTLSVSGAGGAERACASERASPARLSARDFADRRSAGGAGGGAGAGAGAGAGGAGYSRASCSRTRSPSAHTS